MALLEILYLVASRASNGLADGRIGRSKMAEIQCILYMYIIYAFT
jgi:hypothetical protein